MAERKKRDEETAAKLAAKNKSDEEMASKLAAKKKSDKEMAVKLAAKKNSDEEMTAKMPNSYCSHVDQYGERCKIPVFLPWSLPFPW